MREDMRAKLSALRAKATQSIARTQEVHEVVEQKREAKQEARAALKLEEPPAPVEKPTKPVSSVEVEGWFREELFTLYGLGYMTSRWTVKERTLAKKLLDTYGAELTERAVRYFVRDWPSLVARSNGKVKGAPNIGFMWGARAMVFGEVQGAAINAAKASPKADRKNADEYRESDDANIGWGGDE